MSASVVSVMSQKPYCPSRTARALKIHGTLRLESGTRGRRQRLLRRPPPTTTKERRATTSVTDPEFTATVVEKAKALGASVAGVADVETLKESPSTRHLPEDRHGPRGALAGRAGRGPAPRGRVAGGRGLRCCDRGIPTPSTGRNSTGTTARGRPATASSSASSRSSPSGSRRRTRSRTTGRPYFIQSTGIFLKRLRCAGGPRMHRKEQHRHHA